MSSRKKILLIDDERYYMTAYIDALKDEGFEILTAGTFSDGKRLINDNTDADAVILDIMMPVGDVSNPETEFDTKMGFMSGLVLARWVKSHHPNIPIIGMSIVRAADIVNWFEKNGSGFLYKATYLPNEFSEEVKRIISKEDRRKRLKLFIVHGQDEAAKYELKNYLQNTLKLPEPIILHEQPSLGRTIIEKFEEETRKVDLVFVLLTPDDEPSGSSESNDLKRRARQNVVFEMGYFYGKLQRKTGRILLLYKGYLELPSDIAGVVYIDITGGIEAAGETIRRELSALI
jgi:DNA-binding NarL/FixJ family response regulator